MNKNIRIFKVFAILLALITMVSFAALSVCAATLTNTASDHWQWELDQDTGTLTILKEGQTYSNIPWEKQKQSIRTVIVNPGVSHMMDSAFEGCKNLSRVTLPDSVQSIGAKAFKDCVTLSEINLPSGIIDIESEAFSGCVQLKGIDLPTGLLYLGSKAFFGCSSFTEVVIPKSLGALSEGVFLGCDSLKKVTVLPFSMEYYYYTVYPAGVTLYAAENSTTAEYAEEYDHPFVSLSDFPTTGSCGEGVEWSYDPASATLTISGSGAMEDYAPYGTEPFHEPDWIYFRIEHIVIEEGVTYIGRYALRATEAVTLQLPESVTEIGASAFTDNENLKKLVLPSKECKIRFNAFENCGFEEIYFPETFSYSNYESMMFEHCDQVERIYCHSNTYSSIKRLFPDAQYIIRLKENETPESLNFYDVIYIDNDLFMHDVSAQSWYYEAVKYALENGLFNGTSEHTFSPNNPMNRAMLVSVLWRGEGSPAPTADHPFSDVPEGKYYTEAVTWAQENGYITGKTATTFAPSDQITREQMATILYRYAVATEKDTSAETALESFPDASDASSYAQDALEWAVGAELITGVKAGEQTLLRPSGTASRAQVATILMRFRQKYN